MCNNTSFLCNNQSGLEIIICKEVNTFMILKVKEKINKQKYLLGEDNIKQHEKKVE